LSKQICAAALARGHEVVAAARGVHGQPPAGVRFVVWDRAESPPDELRTLVPEVVIDVTGTPAFAARAVATWSGAHWIFISTISVYADASRPGGTVADTPVLEPLWEGDSAEAYGPMKVACEQVIRDGAASSLALRPGLIVGPGDPTGRFTYWPYHAREAARDGSALLVPGTPNDPVQYIDVRDLAAWVVRAGEQRLTGCFDAVGPAMARAEFVAGLMAGVGTSLESVYVPTERLVGLGVAEWYGPGSIPLWISSPEAAGLMARNVAESLKAGLVVRPLADTVRDILAWLEATPDAPVTGLTRSEELALL